MLTWLLSFLPPPLIDRMLKGIGDVAADRGILDDMAKLRPSGQPFVYVGDERLHREQAYASFEVADIWSGARWGVTFDAIRKADPEWSDMITSVRKLSVRLMLAGNALFAARQFEKDGSLLVRDLEVQA